MSGVEILVGDRHGIYVPQAFAERFGSAWTGYKASDLETVLAGPDEDWYWDAWTAICDSAFYVDGDGAKWTLMQEGDLFAYCRELMSAEERKNFFDEDDAEDDFEEVSEED